MSDFAASGGYYISAPADEIIASPATITGSIGIFADHSDVQTQPRPSSASASMGSAPRRCRARCGSTGRCRTAPRRLLQITVDHAYERVPGARGRGRNKTRDAVDAIAQGRVWAGSDALPHRPGRSLGSSTMR